MNRGLGWSINLDVVDAGTKPLLGFARVVQRTETQTKRAAETAKKAGLDLKELGGAAKLTQAEFDALTTAEKKAVVESTKLGTSYGKVALGAVQLEQKLEKAADAQRKLTDATEDGARTGGKLKASMAGVGAIAGGALASGINGALDIEEGRATLKAQMGLTATDAKRAGHVAGDLYAHAYGDSMESVNEAVTAVGQNISRVADTSKADLERLTGNTLNLQKAFGAEAQETTRTVGQLVRNGMAKDVDEAFDLITVGFQRGADKGGEFLDTLNEYSEPIKSLGLDAKDFTGILVEGAENGVYSVDKIGDAFKEFSIRAVDGSTATKGAFKTIGLDADEYAAKIVKGGPAAKKATSEIMSALAGVSDPVKREAAGVALFGSMFEDLGSKAILGLNPARTELKNTSGAAKQLGDDLGGTSKAKITEFKRELEQGLANVLADKVIPGLEGGYEAAKPVLKVFGDVAEAAGELGEKHPELVQAATALVGVGVAVKGIKFASAITGVSSLLRGLGRLTGVGKSAGNRLGDALGDELADAAASSGRRGLSRAGAFTGGGVRGRMTSVGRALGGWLGLPLGERAADAASDALGRDGAITGKSKGRMSSIGRTLGKGLGLATGAAAVLEITKAIGDGLDRLILGKNNQGKKDARDQALDPLGSNSSPLKPLVDGVKGLFKRGGGVIRRFREGGLVPAFVSSGEEIEEPDGRRWRVPGPRVAADNVFTWLRDRSKVWTEDSQIRRAAGEHVDVENQVPHFRTGGPVRAFARGGFVSTAYGPPWNAMNGTGVTATGINLKGGAAKYIVAVDPSVIPLHTKTGIWPNPFGYRGKFAAEDTGGAIKGKRIDFYDWRGRASQMAWGKKTVSIGTTTSKDAAGASSSGSAGTPDRTKTITERVRLRASTTRARDAMSEALQAGLDRGASWTRAQTRLLGNPYLGTLRQELDEAQDSYTRQRTITIPGIPATAGAAGSVAGARGAGSRIIAGARKAKAMGLAGAKAGLQSYAKLGGQFGLHVSSGRRPGAITSSGNPSQHGTGDALDLSGSASGMLRFARWMGQMGLAQRVDQLIHTPLGYGWNRGKKVGLGFFGATVNRDHFDHVHIGDSTPLRLRRGGAIRRFAGGGKVDAYRTHTSSSAPRRGTRARAAVDEGRRRVEALWPFAAPYFPASAGMPPTVFGASKGIHSAYFSSISDPSGRRKDRYVSIPDWGLKWVASKKPADQQVGLETVLHEWAHHFQSRQLRRNGSTPENEGGAQAWTRRFAGRILGAAGYKFGPQPARTDSYMKYVRAVRKTYGDDWIARGQFTDSTKIKYPRIAEFRRGGRARAFAGGGVIGVGPGDVAPPTGRVGSRVDAVLKSTTDRNLAVLDRTIARLTEDRLLSLQGYLAGQVNRAGDARAKARVEAALKQVSEQFGFRIARTAAAAGSRLDRITANADGLSARLERRGIASDSIAGREATIAGTTDAANAALGEQYRLQQERRRVLEQTRGMTPTARKAALEPIDQALAAAAAAAKGFESQLKDSMVDLARARPQLEAQERTAKLDLQDALAGLTGTTADDRDVLVSRGAEAKRQYETAKATGNEEWMTQSAAAMATAATALRDFDAGQRESRLAFDDAMAALTDDTGDDLEAARRREASAQQDLDQAKAELAQGDESARDRATQAAVALKAAKDNVKALTENTTAMQELTAQTAALADLQRQTLEAAQRTEIGSRASQAAILAALAGITSRSVGTQLVNAAGTPAVAGHLMGGI